MPREHAQVNIGIWEDPDFRALPPQAQHLYFVLWMDPGLSYCGVVDWRPGRIAPRSAGWRVDDLKDAADCLRARHFIVTDDESEECLIRSWVRWDGLMKQPRLAVSYANAYGSVGSNLIRGVVIDELHKLRERQPDLPGLSSPRVVQMFELPRVRAKGSVSVRDPFGDGFGHRFPPGLGETLPSVSVPPTPSPSPSPISDSKERCASAGAPARFDEFWSIYPEKKGKQTAIKAWKNAVKVADPDVIIAGARRYARWLGEQREKDATTKAKYPEGWLNAGRWEDELDAPEQPPEQRGSFTAPPLPDGAPRTMFVPWNRAHRDAWLAGKPGPTDWHEIQVAS